MYVKRHLEGQILDASKVYPVVMVCGQRQVGKSTMLYHIKDDRRTYVTLDDWNARRLAQTDPSLFFETYGDRLLIDEFQRVPSLLLEIKKIVDLKTLKGEDAAGLFWLTSSQRFQMMQNISESLAGRVAVFDMPALSKSELENRDAGVFCPKLDDIRRRIKTSVNKDIHEVFSDIFCGGMPKLRCDKPDRDRYYMDYVNTYIERDVKELAQVGKLSQFYDFLVFVAARTGQELCYGDIAKSIGISAPTVKKWISILERSGIIYILRPYFSNISKRLVKTPKLYFMDTGLAAYLCRWPTAATLENGAMDGAFFETYVVTEIVKSFWNAGKRADLYYYRDVDRREVDLVMVTADAVYPIEIKKGKTPTDPDKNFGALEKLKLNVAPGIVICMSDELIPYNRRAWYCPISIL